MTRFEKWARQQDRVDIICGRSVCDNCILFSVCKREIDCKSDWKDACEAYLDEEVDDEESTKRTD